MAARKSKTNVYSTVLSFEEQAAVVVISNKCGAILCIIGNAFGYEFQPRNVHIMPNINRHRLIEARMADFHFL
jgi:hypothetical protein